MARVFMMGISIAVIGTGAWHTARPQEYVMKTFHHPNQPERPRDGAPDPERDDEDHARQGSRMRNASHHRRKLRRTVERQSVDVDDAASAWYSFRRL